jgi:hypothetical protein
MDQNHVNGAMDPKTQSQTLQPNLLTSSLNNITIPIPLLKQQSTEVIKGGSKLKFTALDCCNWTLGLGSNTGSLYLYDPESLRLFTLISNKDLREPIVKLKFSPSSNSLAGLVAIATSKQALFLMEINLQSKKDKERIAFRLPLSTPSLISYFLWDDNSTNIYFGDDAGGVFVANIETARKSKNYLPELLFRCDSNVIQLFLSNEKLLACSLTRSLLFDLKLRRSLESPILLSSQTQTTTLLMTSAALANPTSPTNTNLGPIQVGSQLRDGRFVFIFV